MTWIILETKNQPFLKSHSGTSLKPVGCIYVKIILCPIQQYSDCVALKSPVMFWMLQSLLFILLGIYFPTGVSTKWGNWCLSYFTVLTKSFSLCLKYIFIQTIREIFSVRLTRNFAPANCVFIQLGLLKRLAKVSMVTLGQG